MRNPERQSRTPYHGLIDTIAAAEHLQTDLVEAIVVVESSGQTDAFRYEPTFYVRYQLASRPEFMHLIPRRVSASYGLMQVLYTTAYEFGFREDPEGLFVPQTGLMFGCRYLQACLKWAKQFAVPLERQIVSAVAAYNGGRNSSNTPMQISPARLQYPARVLEIMQQFSG